MFSDKEAFLYEELANFIAHRFQHTIIQGLSSEIRAVVTGNTEMTMDSLVMEENRYKITLAMKNFDVHKAHTFFLRLFDCISYEDSGIFIRKKIERGVRYLFASSGGSHLSFLCEIDIMPA